MWKLTENERTLKTNENEIIFELDARREKMGEDEDEERMWTVNKQNAHPKT